MDLVKLLLVFSDPFYAEEAAKALCRASGFFRPVISASVSQGFDVLVSDDAAACASYDGRSVLMDCRVSSRGLVSSVCDILTASGRSVPFCQSREGAGEFVMFTSAGGGQGTSTCAVLYSRCLSALESKKVLYVSFDPFPLSGICPEGKEEGSRPLERFLCSLFAEKSSAEELKNHFSLCLSSDVYGVSSLYFSNSVNPLSLLGGADAGKLLFFIGELGIFDCVVTDASSRYSGFFDVSRLCEHRIVVERREDRSAAAVLCREMLSDEGTVIFTPGHDDEAESLDVFCQLGTEVRELAERIEKN